MLDLFFRNEYMNLNTINQALDILGSAPIGSINEKSVEAELSKRWSKSATSRFIRDCLPTQLLIQSEVYWDNLTKAYIVPSQCELVREVDTLQPYTVNANRILMDKTDARVFVSYYTKDEQHIELMSESIKSLLAYYLVVEIAVPMSKDLAELGYYNEVLNQKKVAFLQSNAMESGRNRLGRHLTNQPLWR